MSEPREPGEPGEPGEPREHQRRVRELVSRALDDDGFVLGLPGALEAVAEHARLRAVDEDTFLALARAAYQAVLHEHVPEGGVEL